MTQIGTNVLSLSFFHLSRENFGQSVCIKRPRSSQRLQFFQHDIRCLSFRQSTAQMLKVAMKMCRFHQKTAQMLKCSMQDGASISAMALEQGSLWLEPDAGLLLFCARRPASSGMPLIFSCTLYNPANRVFCTSVHKCSVIICTPSNPKPRALTCPPAVCQPWTRHHRSTLPTFWLGVRITTI